MKPHFILAGMLAATLGSAHAAGLYRWVDQSGKVHYGDVPAEEAGQVKRVKPVDAASDDAGLPYETRRAKEIFPVTLYVADNCKNQCQRARDLLNKRGIPFTEKNLQTQEDIDAFRQLSGGENIPALSIGKNLLVGFQADQWDGELDVAGYPRSAPYGFRPALPSAEKKPPATPAPEANPEHSRWRRGVTSTTEEPAPEIIPEPETPHAEEN